MVTRALRRAPIGEPDDKMFERRTIFLSVVTPCPSNDRLTDRRTDRSIDRNGRGHRVHVCRRLEIVHSTWPHASFTLNVTIACQTADTPPCFTQRCQCHPPPKDGTATNRDEIVFCSSSQVFSLLLINTTCWHTWGLIPLSNSMHEPLSSTISTRPLL